MNLKDNIGRNARPAGCWHVPRISRRVNLVLSLLVYKLEREVIETIICQYLKIIILDIIFKENKRRLLIHLFYDK